MQKFIHFLIILISLNTSAQEFSKKLFYENFVECYYSKKESDPILIYNQPNGIKVGKLNSLTEKNCWYKLAISSSKKGWLKIENILILPRCRDKNIENEFEKYKGYWILAKNLKINIADLNVEPKYGVKFYKKPTLTSDLIYQSGIFLETDLIEINGLWAKVKFVVDGKKIAGWLQRKDQCAYPWTSCPFSAD